MLHDAARLDSYQSVVILAFSPLTDEASIPILHAAASSQHIEVCTVRVHQEMYRMTGARRP